MQESPYTTPDSSLIAPPEMEVPAEITQKIKRGWIAAIISGVLTIGLIVLSVNSDVLGDLVDIWTSIDVLLVFTLAFGIYKKSRAATTLMIVYFLASKIWMFAETGQVSGLWISLIFLYIYVHAMMASYQYHALLRAHNVSLRDV